MFSYLPLKILLSSCSFSVCFRRIFTLGAMRRGGLEKRIFCKVFSFSFNRRTRRN